MDWTELVRIISPPLEAGLEGPSLFLALLALGMLVGMLTGFFGVGGGFLIVPLLNVVLGIRYEVAVGSSLSFMIGTSFSGLLRQRQEGNVQYEIAGYLAAGSIVGAVLGDGLQNFLLLSVAGGQEGPFTAVMHGTFILMLIGTIFAVRSRGDEHQRAPLLLKWGPSPFFETPESLSFWEAGRGLRKGYSVPGSFVVGMLIGLATGLLGIGGGVLLVPVLLGLFGLSHHRAAGTSLGVIFVTSIAGIVKKGLSDIPKVSLPLTFVLLLSSVIGVRMGVFLVKKTGAGEFHRYFVWVLVLTIGIILMDLLPMLLIGF